MATRPPRGRRPSGSPDTRSAILTAAVELFAESGYERTTIRAVARRAEVDPALVHHYFGDKEGLLAEAIALPVDPGPIFSGLSEGSGPVGARLVGRVLALYETEPEALRRLLALIRTALSHEVAAQMLQKLLQEALLSGLSGLAAKDRADLRAGLVASQMMGVLLGRYVLKTPSLSGASREELAESLGPTIERYLYGPLSA